MKRLVTGKRLADGVAAVHAIWGVGAVASFPVIIAWPSLQSFVFWPFVAMVSSWFVWKDCPLTRMERWMRSKWDPENQFGGEGFIAHHFGRLTGVRIERSLAQRISYGYTALVLLIIILV